MRRRTFISGVGAGSWSALVGIVMPPFGRLFDLHMYQTAFIVAAMFPVVRGTQYMIGAGNNLEVAAGVQILEKGGNAVDAGVASVLAASVTEMDHFGIGARSIVETVRQIIQ